MIRVTLVRLCAFILDRIDPTTEHDDLSFSPNDDMTSDFDAHAAEAVALVNDASPFDGDAARATTPLPPVFGVWAAEFGVDR